MNHNLFWELVRKDLRMYRSMVLLTLGICAPAVFLITRGNVMFFIGSVLALSSFIILTIFLVQFGMTAERKERVHVFVLSLPITGQQYVLAKIVALGVAFLVPYLLTSLASLALLASYPPSHGFIPFSVTILLYFPMYFAVLIAVTAAAKSDAPNITAVIFFNIAINLIIPGLLRIPSVAATVRGSVAVWTPELLSVIALELGITVFALVLTLWRQRNKTEFI